MKKPTVILLIAALAMAAACQKPEADEIPGGTAGQQQEYGKTDPQPEPEPKPDPDPDPDHPVKGTYFLRVIETTDIHGYIVATENDRTHYRLAYIARKATSGWGDPKRRLMLDAGDLYQGASISNLLEGWPIYTAVDIMGYDAVALGNHEFDWGWETMVDPDATMLDYVWKGASYENKIPVVCANIYRYGSRIPTTKDYVIVEKEAIDGGGNTVKVKIGIIGFAANYAGSIMTSKFTGKGYSINSDLSIAERIASNLESTRQCDATVLLVHGAASAAAGQLSRGSAIDLVLGGHSHAYQNGIADNGIPYMQAGRYAERYAAADMFFNVEESGDIYFGYISGQEIVVTDPARDYIADYLDPGIKEVSDVAIEAISEQLNSVIGHITVDATKSSISGSGGRSCTMGNWMCDITRSIGEADVAFVNTGGIRTTITLNGQPARDITVANVYEMFPFNNTIYVYDITYADLLRLFEYSLTNAGGALFSCVTGIDCHYTSQGRVQSLVKDGETIYSDGAWTGGWANSVLTLAVSEYLATAEDTDYYTHLPNPLIDWNGSTRLINNEMVDNENAIRVLKEEASRSGGLLSIDTRPHFILVDGQ